MAEREQFPVERDGTAPEGRGRDGLSPGRERRRPEKLDELLDEIDQVLEENAEEFVKNYIQKGGE